MNTQAMQMAFISLLIVVSMMFLAQEIYSRHEAYDLKMAHTVADLETRVNALTDIHGDGGARIAELEAEKKKLLAAEKFHEVKNRALSTASNAIDAHHTLSFQLIELEAELKKLKAEPVQVSPIASPHSSGGATAPDTGTADPWHDFSPKGKATAMPSVPATEAENEDLQKRHNGVQYGGQGDKQHLGGFVKFDKDGVSPRAWRYMMQNLTIQSVVDVGCGRGISTSWFKSHGARVLCLEGSHDAVTHSHLPPENIVEHDFTRGPYWPEETFDALWSVEFLEHVGRPYMPNYLPAFHKAALIFASHSVWGGWHHVEVHTEEWWNHRFASQGFVLSPYLTEQVRKQAKAGDVDKTPHDDTYRAQHIWTQLKVYINPAVARLPKHQHLFGGPGCFIDYNKPKVECKDVDALPPGYRPLPGAFESDKAWEDIVFSEKEGDTKMD